MILADAIEGYLDALGAQKPSLHTVKAYRQDLENIGRLLGGLELPIDELTKPALRLAFSRFARDHAKSTCARTWGTWNTFFDYLVADDIVEGNPMEGVGRTKVPKAPVKAIRVTDAAKRMLAAAADPPAKTRVTWAERDVALVATFMITGLRVSEALSLAMGSFSGPPDGRRLSVIGKGQFPRTIPVLPALDALLGDYLASRAQRFPAHRLKHPATKLWVHAVSGDPLNVRQVQWHIENLYRRAGLTADVPPGALVHALRHTFACDALDGGASVLEVSQLLGHTSLDSTRKYVEATGSQLRDAVKGHPAALALAAIRKDHQ